MPPESPLTIPLISSAKSMKVVEQTMAAPNSPTCWYFRRGECHFGWRCKNRHERDGSIVRPSLNTAKVTSDQMRLAATISQSSGPTNWQSIPSQFPVLAHSLLPIVRAPPVVYGTPISLVMADQQQVSDGVKHAMATADAARRKMENPTYHTVLNRLNIVRTRLNQVAVDLRLNEPLDAIPFHTDGIAATDVASAIAANPIDKQRKWRNEFTKAQGDLSAAASLLESLDTPTSLRSNDLVVKQAQQKVNDAARMLDFLVRTHAGLVASVSRAQHGHSQEQTPAGTWAYLQQDSKRTEINSDTENAATPEIKPIAEVAVVLVGEVNGPGELTKTKSVANTESIVPQENNPSLTSPVDISLNKPIIMHSQLFGPYKKSTLWASSQPGVIAITRNANMVAMENQASNSAVQQKQSNWLQESKNIYIPVNGLRIADTV